MPSEVKLLMERELAALYPPGTDYVVVGYDRLSGHETAELRRALREEGVRLRVVKNSIARRALAAAGLSEGARFLEGPSAIVTADSERSMPDLCRAIMRAVKLYEEKLLVRGGQFGAAPLDSAAVARLAAIPPMPVLHAQFIGGVSGVLAGVAGAFAGVARGLACVLEAVRKQKESAGDEG